MKTVTIDIKGVSNSGKSTLMRLISESLNKAGIIHELNDPDYRFVLYERTEYDQQRCLKALSDKTLDDTLEVVVNVIGVSRESK